MMAMALGLILFLFTLSGCSSVPNTIAGLSTLQSTISGSNYVFFVDPSTGRLTPSLKRESLGEPIHAGDYFSVSLDFGFLRYLQAVDPYVIVYSETWMGKNPRPTEAEKTVRQVVLIKEGMAPNSKLPITNFPLLGPVTMGEDLLDVYVTLKVVVLSKNDNAQSIKLVEGIAGAASAAGPQYSALAGAAAATVAAFISQNKDKIEFEHTYVFSPAGNSSQGSQRESHHTALELREGQLITLKGESRFRSIPYPNWQYYLYPFNWFGITPDMASRKMEKESPVDYGLIGAAIHTPQFILESIFSTPNPGNSLISLVDYQYSPMNIMQGKTGLYAYGATPFSFLGSDGMEIVDCSEIKEYEEYLFGFIPNRYLEHNYLDDSKAVCELRERSNRSNESNHYLEKTYMAIRVAKREGSLGTFQELVDHFSEHSKLISEVTTSSSDSRKLTNQRIDDAFTSIHEAILFDRAKQAIRDDAKASIVNPIPEVHKGNQPTLISLQIKETAYHTTRRIIQFAKNKRQSDPNGDRIFNDVMEYIKTQRWDILNNSSGPHYAEWTTAWKSVLESVREELSSWKPSNFTQSFNPTLWVSLATGACQGSLEMPSVSVGDISVYEGPDGDKNARFIVNVLPKPRVPFTVTVNTVDGTAIGGTHYNQINNKSLPVDLEKTSYPIDVAIHGNLVPQNNFVTFNLTLNLQGAEKEKAFLCQGQAIVKILDGDGTVSIVSPNIEAHSEKGATSVKIKFEATPPNPDPIEFEYKILEKETTNATDFSAIPAKPLEITPNSTSSNEITELLGAATKVSVLITGKSNNANRKPIIASVDVKK